MSEIHFYCPKCQKEINALDKIMDICPWCNEFMRSPDEIVKENQEARAEENLRKYIGRFMKNRPGLKEFSAWVDVDGELCEFTIKKGCD